ncbi:hypothetical protein YC2023_088166 [Brassica napus]
MKSTGSAFSYHLKRLRWPRGIEPRNRYEVRSDENIMFQLWFGCGQLFTFSPINHTIIEVNSCISSSYSIFAKNILVFHLPVKGLRCCTQTYMSPKLFFTCA